MTACLEAALAYAAEGLRVLAIEPPVPGDPKTGKRPIASLCPQGVLDATDDPDTIRRWWTACPDAGVAIAVPGDWLVVDVDAGPGKRGEESFERLARTHGDWAETREASTGGGGLHLIYSIRSGSRFPGKLAGYPDIDLKKVGGYVVAAPSPHHTGGTYQWANALDATPAPAWLMALELGTASAASGQLGGASHRELSDREKASLDDLAVALEPHFSYGQRNGVAVAIGGILKNAGLPPSACGYVIDQLPCDKPADRTQDALGAWRTDNAAGWSRLREYVPADQITLIEDVDIRPDWMREVSDRAAARKAQVEIVALEQAATFAGIGEEMSFTASEEPLEYICPPLALAASKGKISILAGFPGAGKGPLLGVISICLALQRPPFAGPRPIKILIEDHEGARLTMRRLRRICRAMAIDPAELAGKLWVRDASTVSAASDAYEQDLKRFVEMNKIELLGLDSYTSAMLDAGVEANAPEYAGLAKGLGQLGICVLATAHSNKAAAQRGGEPRLADLAYSGALVSLAQTVISLSYPDEADKKLVQVGCARAPEEPFRRFGIRWEDTDQVTGPDGKMHYGGLLASLDELPAAPPTQAQGREAEGEARRKAARLAVFRFLCQVDGATPSGIKEGVLGMRHDLKLEAVGEMVGAGIVERKETGTCTPRGDVIYRYQLTPLTARTSESRLKMGLVK